MTRISQRGGFLAGMAVGLLVGLALALAVAMYVTKVPVPFINKVPQRSAEQDASQAEKNRNWDPNAPLTGRAPQRAPAGASGPAQAAPVPTPAITGAVPGKAIPGTPPMPAPAVPATAARPAAVPASAVEAFTYFVQAGAFARSEDAEQQRAHLALLGITARITEREQSGRTMYRVRLGPFERKEEADAAKERLAASGVESALVRVQR